MNAQQFNEARKTQGLSAAEAMAAQYIASLNLPTPAARGKVWDELKVELKAELDAAKKKAKKKPATKKPAKVKMTRDEQWEYETDVYGFSNL